MTSPSPNDTLRHRRVPTPILAAFFLAGCTTGTDPMAPRADAGFADVGPLESDSGARVDAGPVVCDPGAHVGEACATTSDCGDGCFCNGFETCVAGICEAGTAPCADTTECTTDLCDEDTDSCSFEADDAACADGDVCNGMERCVPFAGCRPGLRMTCTDPDPCMVGSCEATAGCTFEVRDLDGDGHADNRCGGTDCFDDPADGATVFPGSVEVCGNGRDDNCNGMVDYRETSCTGTNEDCTTAEALPGAGVYVRTTRGLVASHALGCRATGPDSVFRFTLTSAQDVQASLSVDAGSGSVAIRPAASCASGPDGYCGNTSVLARDLAAGEYVVIVKTSTPTSFTLGLSFLDATPVLPVDVCNDSTLEITSSGTFNGFFADVSDDYRIPCRTMSATAWRDAVYKLVLTESSDVDLTATTMGTTSSPTTYLSLLRDCTNADSSMACVQVRTAEIHRLSMAPGTYYVMIESSSTTAATWRLEVDIRAAMPRVAGDSCGTAIDITGATATVPLDSLLFDHGTSCGGTTASSRDANFTFTLADTRDVILTTEAGGIHYVSVGSVCGDFSTEILCASGTPRVTRRFLRLAAGTYRVGVATNLASGNLVASAEILPPTFPPANDACDMPATLTAGVAYRGDLLAAGNQIASCGPSDAPDTVHQLVLTAASNVTAVARRTDGSSEPIFLGLRSVCDAPSSDALCTSGAPALLNRTLDAGTHYFVVESAPSFVGPYSLIVYVEEP
jgi:hypothetical protein